MRRFFPLALSIFRLCSRPLRRRFRGDSMCFSQTTGAAELANSVCSNSPRPFPLFAPMLGLRNGRGKRKKRKLVMLLNKKETLCFERTSVSFGENLLSQVLFAGYFLLLPNPLLPRRRTAHNLR